MGNLRETYKDLIYMESRKDMSSWVNWEHGIYMRGLKGRGEKESGAEENVELNKINKKEVSEGDTESQNEDLT